MARLKAVVTAAAVILVILVIYSAYYANQSTTEKPAQQSSPKLENLPKENRYIKEFALPQGIAPNAILVDGDFVWIVGNKLIKFDAAKEKIANTYEIGKEKSTLMSWAITKDNDGYIWFARLGEQKIWRFDPGSERLSEYPVQHSIFSMKIDRDTDQIWFSTLAGSSVGVVQKAKGGYKTSEFTVGQSATVSGLTISDGRLYVSVLSTDNDTGNISEFSINREQDQSVTGITKTGQIPYEVYDPTDVIVLGKSIWFTEHGSGLFARYDTESGNLERFHTSENKFHTSTLPLWLRAAGDGFWFNEHGGNRVGFFDAKNERLTEYLIPSVPDGGIVVYPLNIYADPGNPSRAWFSEWNADKIAVVDGSAKAPFEMSLDAQGNRGSVTVTSVEPGQRLFVNGTSTYGDRIDIVFSDKAMNLDNAGVSKSSDFEVLPGKYQNATITISATDGTITKSAFAKYEKD